MPFVTCPDCGRESTAPRDLIGLEWDCPKCGTPFVVRDDDEPRGTPRRKKRHADNTGRWIILGALLLAMVTASIWGGVRWSRPRVQHADPSGAVPSGSGPSAPGLPVIDVNGDGPDWTYREMLEHLRSRGMAMRLGNYTRGQFFAFTDNDGDMLMFGAQLDERFQHPAVVLVSKTGSAKIAREMAGQSESGTFAWGRWIFIGNEANLNKLRTALGATR